MRQRWRGRGARTRRRLAGVLAGLLVALIVFEAGVLGLQLLALRRHLAAATQHLRAAQTTLARATSGGQAFGLSEADLDVADSEIVRSQAEIVKAQRDVDGLRGPLEVGRRLPVIGSTIAVLAPAVDFAGSAAAGGHELMVGLRPAARERDHPTPGVAASARFANALTEGLPQFQASQRDLLAAQRDRDKLRAASVLPPLRSSLAPLDSWDQQWPVVRDDLELLVRLPPVLQAALGYSGARDYAILGQNSAELRPTGGFIGTMGVVHVDHGVITQQQYRSIYTYEPDLAGVHIPLQPAPAPIVEHLGITGWHIQDSNWSPDFPTSATAFRRFLDTNTGTKVDGVVGFDSYAVEDLLRTLGPVMITVDGQEETFTADNWFGLTVQLVFLDPAHPDFLEGRGRVLSPLLQAVIARVDGSTGDQLSGIIQSLRSSVSRRHILFAFDDPAVQRAVYAYDADGRLRPDAAATVIYPVEANLSYIKIGPFIRESSTYELWFDAAGVLQRTHVTLRWENTVTQAQMADLTNRIEGYEWNYRDGKLLNTPGVYGLYERLFTPAQSALMSSQGNDEPISQTSELGFNVFETYLRVAPGQTKQMELNLALPKRQTQGHAFVLDLPKQPGTEDRGVAVTIHTATPAPPDANVTLSRLGPTTFRYEGRLNQSLQLRLDFTGRPGG